MSDAIHSATDVLASCATYVGLWVAGKKHPSFPYGLYKAETVATLVSSIAVLIAAYEIAKKSLLNNHHVVDVNVALPVAGLSLVFSLSFGIYQLKAGKRFNSPALTADAKDYLADSLSTSVVFIGLIGSYFGYNLDRWAAALVSIFVFRAGGELLVSALRDLLDAAIDRDTEREIIRLVEKHPSVVRVKHCLSRTAGGRFIVDMDVILRKPSYQIADKVAVRLEEEIVNRYPKVVMARIRPHLSQSEDISRITPVTGPEGDLSLHIARAPWFLFEVIDKKSGQIKSKQLIANPHVKAEHKRGYLTGKFLLGLKPDQVIVSEKKEGTAVALLEEAGVEIISKAE